MTIAITKRDASDNWHAGRQTWTPDAIVIHVTEGDRASVRSWFALPASDVSAHYMVCTDGTIDQFVDEADTAFHAGRVRNPTAPLVIERAGSNPNLWTIGIEHEGDGQHELTAKQRASSLELMNSLRARWPKILADRRHIIGHHEVYAPKSCPGAINVDRLVAELAGTTKARPVVVWSPYLQDWLVVTQIVSDLDWEFVPYSRIRRSEVATHATTPLSAMPLVAP